MQVTYFHPLTFGMTDPFFRIKIQKKLLGQKPIFNHL